MPKTQTTLSWNELVSKGQHLIETLTQDKFGLGDLALIAAPLGSDGAHNGSSATLDEYAQAIGCEPSSLREYRRVADAWPESQRRSKDASFSVHQELASEPDRFNVLGKLIKQAKGKKITVNDVRTYKGKALVRYPPPARTVKEKVELVREMVADPTIGKQIAKEVYRDREAGANMRRASVEAEREMHTESKENLRKKAGGIVNLSDLMEANHKFADAARQVREATELLRSVDPLTKEARERAYKNVQRVGAAVDFAVSFLKSEVSLEDAIAAMLEAEAGF